MDGLKPWAKQELQRRGVQDLSRAIAAAESFVEFESSGRSSRQKGKSSTRDREESFSSENEFESRPKDRKPMFSAAEKGKWKVGEDRTKVRKPLECFLYAGPNLVKDCSAKAKIAAIARMEESYSDGESHKGPRKLRAIKLQEQSQPEEEPKRVVRLGAIRMLRTSEASQGESQESGVREQATGRAHDHEGRRRKWRKQRRSRKTKKPSNEGVVGLSGGECHGLCVRGGGDDRRGVRGVRGRAHSTRMRREPRERFRRQGLGDGCERGPKNGSCRWRGLEPFPKPNGSKQCLRNVCGEELFIPGRKHCSARVVVLECCVGLLYTLAGATVEWPGRGHCSVTVTRPSRGHCSATVTRPGRGTVAC